MSPWIAIVVSVAALVVSVTTAWLTLFRRGQLRMTQPTVVFFGPDGTAGEGGSKVYFRTLLYSSAKRGQVVESMYITLHRGETTQNFNIWVHSGDSKQLVRGSGLFVPYEGVVLDHHFLLPADGSIFDFVVGQYTVDIWAKLVGAVSGVRLTTLVLEVSDKHAGDLAQPNTGLYFDWGPDRGRYYAHSSSREADPRDSFLAFLANKAMQPAGGDASG